MKNNYSKWLLAAAMATTAIVAPMPEASASKTFKDLDSNSEIGKAMQKLVNLGVLSGFPDNSIRPNDPITREQVAKILAYLTHKQPDLEKYTYSEFNDVSETHWASPFINFSYDYGYMKGDGENFNPSGVLTRGQMAVILDNFFHFEEPAQTVTFTDVKPDAYYASAVNKLIANSITKGTSATEFSPEAAVTRGQLAVFFERSGLLTKLEALAQGIDLSNVPREWTDGGVPEIASYINIEIDDYFYHSHFNLPNVAIRYDRLNSERADFTSEGVEDGTIIAIPHSVYNRYLQEYTDYTVLIEVENNQIKRFKYETVEDLMNIYNRSKGMQNLSAYLKNWQAERGIDVEGSYEYYYYSPIQLTEDDFNYYTTELSPNKYYFNYPNLTPFYIKHSDDLGYSWEFIKITPTGLGKNYDFTFEVGSPTESFILKNKNQRFSFDLETSEGLNYTTDFIQHDEYTDIKINLFVDEDSTSKLKKGDYILYYYYDTESVYVDTVGDEDHYIETITRDYTKYTYNGSIWEVEEWTESDDIEYSIINY